MNFHDRMAISEVFAGQCVRYFESNRMRCAEWGDSGALDGMPVDMRVKLPRVIRYQPDFFVTGHHPLFTGPCFGVDAKSGSELRYCTIEKSAYVTYMEIDQSMAIYVMTDRIWVKQARSVGAIRVRDIQWMSSADIVERYRFAGCPRYPIDRDGWIVPPGKSASASGTPYKGIMSSAMNVICTFKEWQAFYGNGRALF